MSSIAEQYMTPIKTLMKSKEYREFAKLLLKYKNYPRYKNTTINFLDYKFEVVDARSFIFQIKHLFANSLYEFETKSKHPLIYDIGANVGLSLLYFNKKYPGCKIKAFEADPDIADVLERNVVNNSIENVEIINKAAWINNKGVEFVKDNADGGSIYGKGKKVKVESVRLKDLIKTEKKIDLIKMNVEGAEVDLIKDCKDVLHIVQSMYIEYHSFPKQNQELNVVLSILSKNGFRYYIQNVNTSRIHPSIDELKKSEMDMQLHIYAYKV